MGKTIEIEVRLRESGQTEYTPLGQKLVYPADQESPLKQGGVVTFEHPAGKTRSATIDRLAEGEWIEVF